jgi:hypothetical protein
LQNQPLHYNNEHCNFDEEKISSRLLHHSAHLLVVPGPLVLSQAEPTELHLAFRARHFDAALDLLICVFDVHPATRTWLCRCDHLKLTGDVSHALLIKQRCLTGIFLSVIVAVIEVPSLYAACLLTSLKRALQGPREPQIVFYRF